MGEVSAISAILTSVGDVVTAAAGWVGDWVGTITTSGNEVLLLMAVAIPVSLLGVNVLRRLIRL